MKQIYLSLALLFSAATFAQTYDFTTYTPQNTNMINATVNHITQDANGLLWMTSYAGLASFNGTTFTNYTPDNSGLQINALSKVVVDGLNRKWMSTYQNGLIMFNGTTFTHYTQTNSALPSNIVHDLAVDASNNVWIATEGGLVKVTSTNTTWTIYNEVNAGIWGNNVTSVGTDAGNVYIGVANSTLMKMNGTTFNAVNDGVIKIFKVKNDDVYGWTQYGFSKFTNGNTVEYYDYLAGGSCLMDCQPSAIDLDENGKVWISNYTECASGGIQNFTDCANYTMANNDPMNYVMTLKVQSSNVIWAFVAELGLVKMTKNNLSTTRFTNDQKVSAYPNPVQNELHVSAEQPITNVSVFNTLGQQVLAKTINANDANLDVSALHAGTYFVKIESGNEMQTVKVIKQ